MVNKFQAQLFSDLMSLVNLNEAFYFQDFNLEGKTYRIFNYRLASYTDFLQPGAMQCRGTMFEVSSDGQLIGLAALPMEKFFNLNENPMTMDLDLSRVIEVQEKADGSLMSTYFHNDQLRLKSKGSLFSDQAIAAMKYLDARPDIKAEIEMVARGHGVGGYQTTVNLEWCSPDHRIVLGYMSPVLKVMNARRSVDGSYVPTDQLIRALPKCSHVERVNTDDPVAFVASIPSMVDVEGYVIRLASGQRIKIKCDWYLSLHHAKDSVTNPRRLFECILDEAVDDLRSMFATDPLSIRQIDEMQVKVDHIYNSMVKSVETFYDDNKSLDRKSYAISAQENFKGTLYFGLAMSKYLNKPTDYKQFLKGKWKELGFKDLSVDQI